MKTVGYKKKKRGEGISFYFLIHFTWQVEAEAEPYLQGRESPNLSGSDGKEGLDEKHWFIMH